jgi:hypothetical protein
MIETREEIEEKERRIKIIKEAIHSMCRTYYLQSGSRVNIITVHPDNFRALKTMHTRLVGAYCVENPTFFGIKLVESPQIKENEICVGREITWKFEINNK